jgi:hypothetical protein
MEDTKQILGYKEALYIVAGALGVIEGMNSSALVQ